jgi:hypothetical protein
MQDFVMKDRGNAQPRVLNQPFLHGVGEDGPLAWAHSLSLSGDLPDSIFKDFTRLLRRELSTTT